MKKIVTVSVCAQIVEGADRAILNAIWAATKDIEAPYRISRMVRTGDAERFLIEVAA